MGFRRTAKVGRSRGFLKGARGHLYLPLLLDVTNREILLLGAGRACAEKLRTLSQLEKTITVIAEEFSEPFRDREWIHCIQRRYRPGDLKGYGLVYCGINDPEKEAEIRREATELGIPINFVDQVESSDFISPSALIKKNFALFVSTFGRGPGMTKRIRKLLEKTLDLEALDREAGEYIAERDRNRKVMETGHASD